MGLKKIVLITTGQPATNPRIVKEAEALQAAGFDVSVLYSYFIDWAKNADEKILKSAKWKYELCAASPSENKLLYLYTKARFKLARYLNRTIGNKGLIAERAQARGYDELLKKAKKIKADWYIGHNLGALAIAVRAARFNKAKAGFDFEDYHRGEHESGAPYEINRILFLEARYVSSLDHISAASPMIAEKIQSDFPLLKRKVVNLYNCFPLSQQPDLPEEKKEKDILQLFWFSQTIGANRGLEVLIESLLQLNDTTIHLTLAGKPDAGFLKYLQEHASPILSQIHFAGIISPDELPAFASAFDVGLALELPTPINRDICLTNKIFTYLLAGNAIILSGTSMQKNFNELYNIGQVCQPSDSISLASSIYKYRHDMTGLWQQKKYNYRLAREKFNWDIESGTLIKQLSTI